MTTRYSERQKGIATLAVLLVLVLEFAYPRRVLAFTTRFVGPVALLAGDCSDTSNACLPATCLALMSPGDTCTFASGTYSGSSSKMIQPSAALNWDGSNRFVVISTTDGGAILDGTNSYQPVALQRGSNGWDIEGFNFRNGPQSPGAAIVLIKSSNNIFRRDIGSDASNLYNVHVWSIQGNVHYDTVNGINNLFEDIGGFGQGRKMFETLSNNGPNTVRRGWFDWCESESTGPKQDIETTYYSRNLLVENTIMMEHGCTFPNPYTLTDGSTGAALKTGVPPALAPCPVVGGSCTGGVPQAAPACSCKYGAAVGSTALVASLNGYIGGEYKTGCSAGGDCGNVDGNVRVLGSMFFATNTTNFDCYNGSGTPCSAMFASTLRGNTTMRDVIAYVKAGVLDRTSGKSPIGFKLQVKANCSNGDGCSPAVHGSDSSLTNATSIAPANSLACTAPGGAGDGDNIDTTGSSTSGKYVVSNMICSNTLAGAGLAVYVSDAATPESLYTGVLGAKMRYRYVNGLLTSAPLWDNGAGAGWPMSARILAETTAISGDGHGHTIINIDSLIQGEFGPFPPVATATPGGASTNTPTTTLTPSNTPIPSNTPTVTPTFSTVCRQTHTDVFPGGSTIRSNHGVPCMSGPGAGQHGVTHTLIQPTPAPTPGL